MEVYEYVFAALVMVSVFTAAVYLAVTVLPPYRSVSEVDQLKIAAQKVMNNILLNPGYPHDWGGDVSVRAEGLASFGLASYTVLTREAYVLDQDKVQRLSPEAGPLYVPPKVVLDLLGLGLEYGIKLEFIPVLNVRVEASQGSGGVSVRVRVTSERGVPVEGASVAVVAVCASGGGLDLPRSDGRTDANGLCALSIGCPQPVLLITIVDFQGARAVSVSTTPTSGSNVYRSLVFGKYLLVDESIGLSNPKAHQLFVSAGSSGALEVRSASCALTLRGFDGLGGYNVYDMGFEEPSLVAVVVVDEGRFLVAYKLVPESYSSIAGEVRPPISYSLERGVRIGLSHYNLRLTIWRMSW